MRTSDTPLLEIDDLSVVFRTRSGDVPAVTGFSTRIAPGEALGLVGESGCGKSTVALAIMRHLGPSGRIAGGAIRFRGRDLVTMGERDLRAIRGRAIAMIYQEPMASLNPAMTVGRQLMEVPRLHFRASRAEARRAAIEAAEAVRLADAERILDSYPHQLSGGQQQRIVIAMALMARPALLILDEPTTALDVTVEAGIIDLIRDLGRTTGTAMLFISHNLGLVLETCDSLCVMYAGEAIETGPVGEVFAHMRHPYTHGLMRSIPLPGADKTGRPLVAIPGTFPLPHERPPGCTFAPRCAHAVAGRCDARPVPMEMVRPGHASRCLRWREIDWGDAPEAGDACAPVEPGATVIEAHRLAKHYPVGGGLFGGEERVLKANEAVSFVAREAETLAIVGESGSGKSTLAKMVLGLETATGGRLELDGLEIGTLPVERRDTETVAAVQMVFQNPFDTLNPSMSVGAQIIRTLEKFGIGRTQRERRARMFELLDLVRLPRAFARRMPRQLSGGQKQRVGIARAFAGNPRVVVADEPVSALDVSVQASVMELLAEIQRESRTTMLFISHDLAVVRYLADRVMVMYLGYVVEIGATAQVFEPPYHPYTEALVSAAPVADAAIEKTRIVLEGEIPSPVDPPPGCPFQTRCHRRHLVPGDRCVTELPELREIAPGHRLRCHLDEAVLATMEPVIRHVDRRG
jgi:peptide/nickel transport system ATP-binding protein